MLLKAPSISGSIWINSAPLSSYNLSGKVILFDFWTYSCVNCLRTLPFLKNMHEKYKGLGLEIIGIHTPEFSFEKDLNNVKKAVLDLGINYPVVLDNDYVNWNNFDNRYWPAKYLVDQNGFIVYEHFGEGNFAETEMWIRKLLGSTRENYGTKILEHAHGDVCFIPTPETYLGFNRGRVVNREGFAENQIANYSAPSSLPLNGLALNGQFLVTEEYAETRNMGSSIILRFHATEVNLVIQSSDPKTISTVSVKLDDQSIPSEVYGKDLVGNDELEIAESRMYNLLKSQKGIEGTITVSATKGNFRAFAFSFSGCEG